MGGITLRIPSYDRRLRPAPGGISGAPDGLNILQAPNEAGKSTWCAFLLSILYGINSRERDRAGFIADKNRYAPWSGIPMSGRLDCAAEQGEITLTRSTRRQTSPMGEFRAVYAGTNEPVPGLTGSNCGEELLGVSREVYARSAFIRQNGLAISQDAELERRIAALISSGEEDTSFTEARDALKRQLNRRRHNKTGQLPALEAERSDLERRRAESAELSRQLAQARRDAEVLAEREAALLEELDHCDRWEALRRRSALTAAEAEAAAAEQRAEDLRRRIEADRVPENDAIARLRGGHRQSGDHPESRGQGPGGAGRGHEGPSPGRGRRQRDSLRRAESGERPEGGRRSPCLRGLAEGSGRAGDYTGDPGRILPLL